MSGGVTAAPTRAQAGALGHEMHNLDAAGTADVFSVTIQENDTQVRRCGAGAFATLLLAISIACGLVGSLASAVGGVLRDGITTFKGHDVGNPALCEELAASVIDHFNFSAKPQTRAHDSTIFHTAWLTVTQLPVSVDHVAHALVGGDACAPSEHSCIVTAHETVSESVAANGWGYCVRQSLSVHTSSADDLAGERQRVEMTACASWDERCAAGGERAQCADGSGEGFCPCACAAVGSLVEAAMVAGVGLSLLALVMVIPACRPTPTSRSTAPPSPSARSAPRAPSGRRSASTRRGATATASAPSLRWAPQHLGVRDSGAPEGADADARNGSRHRRLRPRARRRRPRGARRADDARRPSDGRVPGGVEINGSRDREGAAERPDGRGLEPGDGESDGPHAGVNVGRM